MACSSLRSEGLLQAHVVGDAFVDVLAAGLPRLPGWGDDVSALIRSEAGGSALNTAVHLGSILGRPGCVHFHGCVGDDAFGQSLRARLERAGVRQHIAVLPEQPTGSCIVLSGTAGRSFVTCAGATGAMAVEHLPGLTAALDEAEGRFHVHFAGFYAYGPLRWQLPALLLGLRCKAAARGVRFTASADLNGAEAQHLEGFGQVLGALDLFRGNRQEAAAAVKATAEAAAGARAENAEALARTLAEGERCAVVTDGEHGAAFAGGGLAGRVPASSVEVSDTTGAGDACCAAFLASWLLGDGLEVAATRGCAAGSVNCTRIGGCSLPVTHADLDLLLSCR